MLLAICQTRGSGAASIAEKLARRLDIPCYSAQAVEKAAVQGPCILVEEPDGGIPAHMDGLVRVLIHRGECVNPTGYDLAVDSAPLGEEATVELLSQFVALKVMSQRTRHMPGGGRFLL